MCRQAGTHTRLHAPSHRSICTRGQRAVAHRVPMWHWISGLFIRAIAPWPTLRMLGHHTLMRTLLHVCCMLGGGAPVAVRLGGVTGRPCCCLGHAQECASSCACAPFARPSPPLTPLGITGGVRQPRRQVQLEGGGEVRQGVGQEVQHSLVHCAHTRTVPAHASALDGFLLCTCSAVRHSLRLQQGAPGQCACKHLRDRARKHMFRTMMPV